MESAVLERARELVMLEGYYLDMKMWDEWLHLYAPNCTYWVPSWKSDVEVSGDPQRELSLIYYSSRAGLEDRVFRIRTGTSLSSTPFPRTAHLTCIARSVERPEGYLVDASWMVRTYRMGKESALFGLQSHLFQQSAGELKIVHRRTVVHNDTLAEPLDIYSI